MFKTWDQLLGNSQTRRVEATGTTISPITRTADVPSAKNTSDTCTAGAHDGTRGTAGLKGPLLHEDLLRVQENLRRIRVSDACFGFVRAKNGGLSEGVPPCEFRCAPGHRCDGRGCEAGPF